MEEEVIFIDSNGNIIQYNEICSHIGLASKIISEDEHLKELFKNSKSKRTDIFLIYELGYISVSVDPVYGIYLIANYEKLTEIQRKIVLNYGISGAKMTLLNCDIEQDTMTNRHKK